MTRPALAALVLALLAVGPTAAQGFPAGGIPFETPKPLGGPIVGPDGKVLSGLDTVSPWCGGVEFGISGSEGNTETLKIRTGIDLKYDTPEDIFIFSALYVLTRQQDALAEHKALIVARNELPFDEVWAWFVQGQLEYDEFRDVDFRVAGHNGLVFTAIKDQQMLLKFRGGLGASRELGGTRNDWVPEAQLGGDFDYLISPRTKFCLSADYYPDLHDLNHYRLRGRASFDFLIDPDLNLLLRLGVQDRYDSHPLRAKRNDLDYFMTLLFRF
jgi:hypothetical protein